MVALGPYSAARGGPPDWVRRHRLHRGSNGNLCLLHDCDLPLLSLLHHQGKQKVAINCWLYQTKIEIKIHEVGWLSHKL